MSENRTKEVKYTKDQRKMACESLSESSKRKERRLRYTYLSQRKRSKEMKKAEVELRKEKHEIQRLEIQCNKNYDANDGTMTGAKLGGR